MPGLTQSREMSGFVAPGDGDDDIRFADAFRKVRDGDKLHVACVKAKHVLHPLRAGGGVGLGGVKVHRLSAVDGLDVFHRGQRRADHKEGLTPRAEHEQSVRFRTGQRAGADRCRRAGAHRGDERGVHDALGKACCTVHCDEDTAERGKTEFVVSGEGGKEFCTVDLAAAVVAGADVHDSAAVFEIVRDGRPDDRLAFGLGFVDALDNVEHIGHFQTLLQRSTVEEANFHDEITSDIQIFFQVWQDDAYRGKE